MKKTYLQPWIEIIVCNHRAALMAGSGNNASGTIHSGGSGEEIGTGDEDDEGGTEASAKRNSFEYEW